MLILFTIHRMSYLKSSDIDIQIQIYMKVYFCGRFTNFSCRYIFVNISILLALYYFASFPCILFLIYLLFCFCFLFDDVFVIPIHLYLCAYLPLFTLVFLTIVLLAFIQRLNIDDWCGHYVYHIFYVQLMTREKRKIIKLR